jgi:hypothetical protein
VTQVCELSVVVAVQHAEQNLTDILTVLDPASHPGVEFIFCMTEPKESTLTDIAEHGNVNMSYSPEGSLIPVLWKDGILKASTDKIALTTAHCIPGRDWVNTLLGIDMSATPAVGGVITNDSAANARSWAIYLLRYISFSPPHSKGIVTEIAADNALYRRADVLQNPDLLEDGFWEPSFHKRFHQAGLSLVLDPTLIVTHKNCYTTRQFFQQRLAHGKAFGMERCEDISDGKRRLLIFLSPLLPFLFLTKICLRVLKKRKYTGKLLLSLPWLMVFLTAWGIGEAKGYLAGAGLTSQESETKQGRPES